MGVLVRLAVRKAEQRRSIYTIHGFDTILKAHRIFLPLERMLARRCGAVVPVSFYDEQNVLASGIKASIRMIHNGVSDRRGLCGSDPAAVAAMKTEASAGKTVVLSVARLATPKRFDLFVALATACPNMAFFWIGNSQDAAQAAGIAGMPLPPNLSLLGELAEAGNYCNLCDVFVLLSDYEGLPMSILEAMSCGKPVVASDVGGIKDAVNPENGILVANTLESAQAAVAILTADTVQRMGLAARARYEKEFSAKAMYTSYKLLYKELES